MSIDIYESLFTEISYPGLVIHAETQIIQFANKKSLDLSGYSLQDLLGKNIHWLMPEYKINLASRDLALDPGSTSLKPVLFDRSSLDFVHYNQTHLPVQVKSYHLPALENEILLVIDPNLQKREPNRVGQTANFWQSMEMIAEAARMDNLEDAMLRIINISQGIAGTEFIYIYRMAPDEPVLKKWIAASEKEIFPTQFTSQELANLGTPLIWKPGIRTSNLVHRLARQSNMAYVASTPLGDSQAMIGLVIIAGLNPPAANLFNFQQYLSAMITTLLEQHSYRSTIQRDLESNRVRLNSTNIVEEKMSDGLLLLSKSLEITRMNLAAETILGYKNIEVLGQPVDKVLIGAETIKQALHNAQNSNNSMHLGDNIRLYRRNGESFQAVIRIFPVVLNQKVEEILVLFQDLSEQEFIKLQAQQLEQRAFLGEVTATFAHEIRNPVHNISTGLQLLAINLPKDDPKQQAIDCMIQDCDRLAELIKSVLAFSKPVDYVMENVDIGHMLTHLLERLSARIKKANVQYDLQIATDCPFIYGNMHALEQVINNLVSNALQAMDPDGGRLVVKAHPLNTSEGRQYLEISVADTGPGIPKENQERVFQPFFTTERKGTGLGLAVAKRIITAHKGNIRLTSFPGGTIFHIQLPASKE